MGLDIHISTDNDVALRTPDYYDPNNGYFNKHSLSREFCNFMCRKDVISHEPELDQIGRIAEIDISSIYKMESIPDEESLQAELYFAESEDAKQSILELAAQSRGELQGNIDNVLQTVSRLIEKLNDIEDLPGRLLPTDFDTLNAAYYFSDFKIDKGEG